jgi:hypothetical protein
MNINKTIIDLKNNNEDFEFYPTTDEILKCIYDDNFNSSYNEIALGKVLDIGAGNFKFYNKFYDYIKINNIERHSIKYRFIEKSKILIQQAPKEAIPVGVDFNNFTLIGKKFDLIFCNPPYSEFVDWMQRILKESDSKNIYFVVSQRWEDNAKIKEIIKNRDYNYKVLMTTDFFNAERKARCKVDVIRFSKKYEYRKSNVFKDWFLETFNFELENKNKYKYEERQEKSDKIKNEMEIKKDIIEVLIDNYNKDMEEKQNIYYKLAEISKIDNNIFKEINIDLDILIKNLEDKLINLKSFYWNELFNRLDKITSRLTVKSRDDFYKIITETDLVEFNKDNILAIVIWVIKNANNYYNNQLIDLFYKFISPDNIKKYKSNFKTWELSKWRHNSFEDNKKITHFSLDYRIIIPIYDVIDLLKDICVIANNLGFQVDNKILNSYNKHDNEKISNGEIYFLNNEVFFEYKYYKNKNLHIKFNQEFLKAFNIEAGRLLGWLKNKQDIKENLENISDIDIDKYFNKNIEISMQNNLLMLE